MTRPSIVAAEQVAPAALAELFTRAYSDYFVPLRFDAAALADHVREFDIDLRCSRVVLVGEPAAFALIARRRDASWIGGMGTAPAHRRRGLGESALRAALEAAAAAGCRETWLEVIDANRAAEALYVKLGFEVVRDLIVWSLVGGGRSRDGGRPAEIGEARSWIAAHRRTREPWQRADRTLANIERAGGRLRALMHERSDGEAAAVIYRDDSAPVAVLQVTALDDSSAADALLATAAGRELRLANVAEDEPPSRALATLGARIVVRQHEMRLQLT